MQSKARRYGKSATNQPTLRCVETGVLRFIIVLASSLATCVMAVVPAQAQDIVFYQTQVNTGGTDTLGCPPNHALGGVTFGSNGFVCRYVGDLVESAASTTVVDGIMSCSPGDVITAMTPAANRIQCARTTRDVSTATITSGRTDTQTLSECVGSSEHVAAVLVGFDRRRSLMRCAAVPRQHEDLH